ncbi:unnamed protein product [Vitrella brassicaformis CCMP3155]|uniref:CBM20 domain-containing protein n=1 Tax=Vitrella brassicaformis (strain CCMP3155) TaxID=1169540 RepID=A0A0G4GW36_VITBC|nr:unnamed protein product [Vitrella brassicaformis CCMP3155]|eukprot:CEM35097.1 unnamed protein product [Vitrella brassicaformis CCMP3155]
MESVGGHGAAVRFVAEVPTDICGWGQEVRVCGNYDNLGGPDFNAAKALPLTTCAATVPIWSSEPIAIQPVPDSGQIEYKLLVHDPSEEDRWERAYGEIGQHRTATIMEGHLTTVHDRWDKVHHTKVTISPSTVLPVAVLVSMSRRDVYAQADIEPQDISPVSNHELSASVQKALQDRIAEKEVLGVGEEEDDGGEEHEAGRTDSMVDDSVEDRVVDWMELRTPSEQAAMLPIMELIAEERYEEAGEEIRRKFNKGKSGQEIIDEIWVQPAAPRALQELEAACKKWQEDPNTSTDKKDKTIQDYARNQATQIRSKMKDLMRDRRRRKG